MHWHWLIHLALSVQTGWPDAFLPAVGWKLENNDCEWCPADDSDCDTHHQSPINLERNRALPDEDEFNECIDVHLMKFHDSTCDFDQLVEYDAFTVERHALKIKQPIVKDGDNEYRLACKQGQAETRRFGRIDFSKGFSHWWHLSHIDFHVPSEHTQEGKRYDAEMQMYHFYSKSAEEAGVENEMASVTVFLQAYEDTGDYYMLNKVICQWRRYEEETREQCGLPSVTTTFKGCTEFNRGGDDNGDGEARRRLRSASQANRRLRPKSKAAHDIIIKNYQASRSNMTHSPSVVKMEKHDFEIPDIDWEEFIKEVEEQEAATEQHGHGRHLIDYSSVGPFNNYFGLLGVKTEYYYRYSGTQTVPPCYGEFIAGSRAQTNHWRIMKDPIRVSTRQIDEMHRLLRERIAPVDDPIRPCEPDTAAAKYEGDDMRVNVSRPLMATSKAHYKVFCECENWKSQWEQDKAWCELDKLERFYDHPYNFDTDGF